MEILASNTLHIILINTYTFVSVSSNSTHLKNYFNCYLSLLNSDSVSVIIFSRNCLL